MKKTRIQVPKLRMTVFALACLLLGGAFFTGCAAKDEKPPLPAALNYMPISYLETRLSEYFPAGMSKADVEAQIQELDGLFVTYGNYENGVYLDADGNALRFRTDMESEVGVTSYRATFTSVPLATCFAYFAFDEDDCLIGVWVGREWALY